MNIGDKTTLFYYNIQNNGDGSVSIRWYDSQELAEWDEEHMDEGWGEPCNGSISVAHNGNVRLLENVYNPISYLLDKASYSGMSRAEVKEFVDQFLPNGIGKLELIKRDDNYFDLLVDNKFAIKAYAYNHKTDSVDMSEENKQKILKRFKKDLHLDD